MPGTSVQDAKQLASTIDQCRSGCGTDPRKAQLANALDALRDEIAPLTREGSKAAAGAFDVAKLFQIISMVLTNIAPLFSETNPNAPPKP